MTEFEITIRAAALYRIVGNAQTFKLNEGKDVTFLSQLMKKLELCETPCPALDALACMVMDMSCGGALAQFPVSDVDVLGEIVRYMIKFYKTYPELAANIATMCGLNSILGDGYGCILVTLTQNARFREIAELNNNFYCISKAMGDSPDINVRTEFITMETHLFHPDSQFIRVVVTV
jgi:hypothetical protein